MEELIKQDIRLFEPYFDNINTVEDIKELLKAFRLTIAFDMSDIEQYTEARMNDTLKEVITTKLN